MPSIQDYVDNLKSDKHKLVDNLTDMGVSASDDETFTELAPKVLDIPSSLVKGEGNFLVQVLDYDGTILKAERHNRGEKFKLPVAPPEHNNLTFQEWISTADIVDGEITVESDELVGPFYETKSGYNELDIELTASTGLNVTLKYDVADWGDGTSGGTSHTYPRYGNYTIKIDWLYGSGYSNITGSQAVSYFLKEVRLKGGITSIPQSCFSNFYGFNVLSIPKTLTSFGSSAIQAIAGAPLKVLVLPDAIKGLSASSSCYVDYLVAKNIQTFYYFDIFYVQLKPYTYPSMPDTIYGNNIRPTSNQFKRCLIDMRKLTSIPRLYSRFQNIGSGYFLIKDTLYDDWIKADNWNSYTDRFIPYDIDGNLKKTTILTLTTSLADTTINVATNIYTIVEHNYTLPSYSDLTTTIAEANLAWSDGTNTYALGETIEAPDAGTTTFDLIDTTV